MNKNKLYLLLAILTTGGYIYLGWAISRHHESSSFSPCLVKNVTGIACPSCGNTRSVMSIIKGNFANAALINPLGFIVAALMVILPFWLLYDVIAAKDTLYRAYRQFEKTLQVKWVAIMLIVLILINWIWNISKGL